MKNLSLNFKNKIALVTILMLASQAKAAGLDPAKVFPNDKYHCTNFVGASISGLAAGTTKLGDLFFAKFAGAGAHSFPLFFVLEGDKQTATLSQGNGSVPFSLVAMGPSIGTPIGFYRSDRPATNKELTGRPMEDIKKQLLKDHWPTMTAIVVERYALIYPSSGEGVSFCKLEKSDVYAQQIKEDFARVQEFVRSSDMMNLITEDQDLFPIVTDYISHFGLVDGRENAIAGNVVRAAKWTAYLVALAQSIRVGIALLTRQPTAVFSIIPLPGGGQALALDLDKVQLNASEVREFLNLRSGTQQRARCETPKYQSLCEQLQSLEFNAKLASGQRS